MKELEAKWKDNVDEVLEVGISLSDLVYEEIIQGAVEDLETLKMKRSVCSYFLK